MSTERIMWGEDQDPDFVDDDTRRPGEKIDRAPFPVLLTADTRRELVAYFDGSVLEWVPWWLIESHEAQAQKNHSQTLRRLAERGGLCPSELVAVLEDRDWSEMSAIGAVLKIKVLMHKATKHCHDEEPADATPEKAEER